MGDRQSGGLALNATTGRTTLVASVAASVMASLDTVSATSPCHVSVTTSENFASQTVNLRADQGTILEYLPDAAVAIGESRFFQRTRASQQAC
jgi:urease accessory protein UreH